MIQGETRHINSDVVGYLYLTLSPVCFYFRIPHSMPLPSYPLSRLNIQRLGYPPSIHTPRGPYPVLWNPARLQRSGTGHEESLVLFLESLLASRLPVRLGLVRRPSSACPSRYWVALVPSQRHGMSFLGYPCWESRVVWYSIYTVIRVCSQWDMR